MYPRQRDLAMERAYIQPNAPWKTIYLALDVDQQGAEFVVEDAGTSSPTFTVATRRPHTRTCYTSFPIRSIPGAAIRLTGF